MGCTWLIAVGGVMEIIGFGLVAYDLYRIRRREFGTPPAIVRLRAWWMHKVLRRPRKVVEISATLTGGGTLRARGSAREHPGESLEERVDALERNLGHLENEIDAAHREMEQDIDKLRAELHDTRAELDRKHREREEERKAFVGTSLQLQVYGTVLFVLGTTLSVIGSAVNC